jgi:hypothetical protein
MSDLRHVADWSAVIAGASPGAGTGCLDRGATPGIPGAPTLDLARLTAERQADSDDRYGAPSGNPDSPRWELLSFGAFDLTRDVSARPYVVVWVSDDVNDGDGNPRHDSNGRVVVRAVGFGIRGARAGVEATIERDGGGEMTAGIRLLTWRSAR